MNNGLRVENGNEVVLCGDRICCPKLVRIGENLYRLTDDNGNSVILTKEQVELMAPGMQVADQTTITEERVICG